MEITNSKRNYLYTSSTGTRVLPYTIAALCRQRITGSLQSAVIDQLATSLSLREPTIVKLENNARMRSDSARVWSSVLVRREVAPIELGPPIVPTHAWVVRHELNCASIASFGVLL